MRSPVAVAIALTLAAALPAGVATWRWRDASASLRHDAATATRAGRYDEAIESGLALARAAERAATGAHASTSLAMDYHGLAVAATLAGRSATAITAARDAARHLPQADAARDPSLQVLAAAPHVTLAAFGRWDDVAREPPPPRALHVATALAWMARGTAAARRGKARDAGDALDTLRAIAAMRHGEGEARILRVALPTLGAEHRLVHGDRAAAIALLEAAAAAEDALEDATPPRWARTTRQLLGATLLEAGRPAEAAGRYAEDLARLPENVWALAGLAQAHEQLGQREQAAAVRRRLARAAARADVTLASALRAQRRR